MTFVASVHMQTYSRTWAQGGTPGYYAMYSTNQENGYVYFVGATTTGAPLNRLVYISHAFTSINIIAPTNDMVSLYKAKVKATTEFPNAFANFSSFPSIISSSGNFVLPNNALPLVNVMLVGSGGGGGHHSGGGGGGGGIVKLTAYQAVGTTSVTVGSAPGNSNNGNSTYFGNVYAIGGGGGGNHGHTGRGFNTRGEAVANGGGGGGHSGTHAGGTGTVQTTSTGLGSSGSPTYTGGYQGGQCQADGSWNFVGAGGAGAGGNGANRTNSTDTNSGGPGHVSNITGSDYTYSLGAGGGSHSPGRQGAHSGNYGSGGHGGQNDGGGGIQGVVVVRYYIP
jgi:hypothetical protein